MEDFDLPFVVAGAGEADGVLAKGLLRRCAALLELKAMVKNNHHRHLMLTICRNMLPVLRCDGTCVGM